MAKETLCQRPALAYHLYNHARYGHGTDVVNLQPDGKGHFSGIGELGMGGNWKLRIEIRTLDTTLHEATLKFFTPY